jgi:hypothetical protein
MFQRLLLFLATVIFLEAWAVRTVADDPRPAIDFDREIAPILVRRCLECHNDRQAAGGLVLTSAKRALAGGDSGASISPGDADGSYLIERVVNGEMPPERQGRPQHLPAAEVETLRRWIAAGAAWPPNRTLDLYEATSDTRGGRDWWSLQPIARPDVPPVPGAAGQTAANPIDAFIVARLAAEGLEPAPVADRRVRLRRLHYDLIGLPPTFEELEDFAADPEENAWERRVDRLLASPQFGERWARHWLDIVRFAETSGYERDQEKPFAWKYRDWVVDAFNSDKPYDRFIVEQLAGDELADRSEETVTATGFLRLGTWNDEPNDPEDYKYERLEDLVHATSTAFLGLTVKCARCHDHKFDPIPQVDYYRIASAFWPGPIEPRARELLGGPTEEELGFADVLGWTDVTAAPSALHVLKNGDRHHPEQAAEPGPLSAVPALFELFDHERNSVGRSSNPSASVLAEQNSHLASSAVGELSSDETQRTTHRRLQLAAWIADPRNPLPGRVVVNRLWLQHFGEGLVRSPDNFGFTGETPTHPDLLDWLAAELVPPQLSSSDRNEDRGSRIEDRGDAKHEANSTRSQPWSLKRVHRLIVTSSTYQQSSLHPRAAEYDGQDAANRLWWRTERRRLDAESLRDSLLAVSGELELRLGGPSFKPTISPDALEGLSRKASAWQASPPEHQRRRSLYMYTQRSLLPPLMTVFDFGDTTLPCGQRDVTTVAPQALALLNDDFHHERSTALARRVAASAGDEPIDRIDMAWRIALGRVPDDGERRLASEHLQRQRARFDRLRAAGDTEALDPDTLALASLCHVLINSNEFLYVD